MLENGARLVEILDAQPDTKTPRLPLMENKNDIDADIDIATKKTLNIHKTKISKMVIKPPLQKPIFFWDPSKNLIFFYARSTFLVSTHNLTYYTYVAYACRT